jgi:hypothetical protein
MFAAAKHALLLFPIECVPRLLRTSRRDAVSAANVERMVTEFQIGLTASFGFVVWSGLAVVVGGP